ncbi:GDSL-type esterase/lipase family protein [Microbacterium sp. 22296]|uniref:SGNH/GDSL hydrolase family protein n=1 Tax=Microbacterium sp. 22296 TaxID=3453903 RepID=UPI003F8633EC
MSKRLTTTPVTIVWLGSSSTAGNNASSADARYVNKTMGFIRAAYPLPSGSHPTGVQTLSQAASSAPSGAGIFGVNAGVSGSRSGNQNGATPYITASTRSQIAALNPRVLVHMIGANDYGNGVPVATYKSNLQSEIAALDAAIGVQHVHVLIHTYPRFDSAALSARVAPWSDYLTALKEIAAAASNVAVIDNSDDWARQGVTGAAGQDPWDYIDTDEIHMNDQGHDFMADLLRTSLLGGALVAVSAATTPPAGTAPTITTSSLNAMTVGQAFSQTLAYTGDTATFTASGLPSGLAISSAGVISGTPTTAGSGNATFTATNSTGSNSKTLAYTVAAASGGGGTLTVLYSDSFDRANTTTVGTSATDAAYGGSAATWQQNAAAWQITSNQLAPTSTSGGQFLPVAQANYEIRALIGALPASTGTTLWTLDGRRSQVTTSGATQYRLYLRADGSGRVTNGSADVLTFAAGTFAAGQWVGLRMNGTTLSVVKATAANDPGVVVTTGTNSDITTASGFAGFSRVNTETTGRWEAVAITAIEGA